MSIKKSIVSIVNEPYIFSIFSKILGVAIAVVYSAFYNRYLGTVLKGDATIISNYISLISSFTAMGMYQAYPFYRKKDKQIFYPFVNNMTSFYFIMTVVALVLTFTLPVDINLKFAIALVPIQSYIRQINYVVMIEAPRRRNISSIIINLADLFVVLSFFLFSEASYGKLLGILIIQNIINLVISYGNLKVDVKKLKFDVSQVVKYLKYGTLPMITLILMTLNYRIDVLMLDDVFAVAKSEIGIYSVGIMLAEKIWLIPDSIKDILMSKLSNGADKSEVSRVTRVSLAVSLAMLVLLAVFGKLIIHILYGDEYKDAYGILLIMLVGVIGMVFYKMVYAFNVVNGKRVVNLVFLGAASGINIIANYFLIPIGGIFAAAWASVISYMVCGFAFLVYFHRATGVKYKEILIPKKSDFLSFVELIKGRSTK